MQCTKQGALDVCTSHPSMCSETINRNSDAQEHACLHQNWTQTAAQVGQRTFGGAQRVMPTPGQTLNMSMRTQVANDAPQNSLAEASYPLRGGQMQPVTVTRAARPQRGSYETLLACDPEGRYKDASELVQKFSNRYDN
jgi:hypothetical protein